MTDLERPRANAPALRTLNVEDAYEVIEAAGAARYLAEQLRDVMADKPIGPELRDTAAFVAVALAARAKALAEAVLDRLEAEREAEEVL